MMVQPVVHGSNLDQNTTAESPTAHNVIAKLLARGDGKNMHS